MSEVGCARMCATDYTFTSRTRERYDRWIARDVRAISAMAMEPATSSVLPPDPGSYIAQRYFVEARLGVGGMAEVLRVRDRNDCSHYALKRLHLEVAERRPALALLFEREYHTLKQLDHPSIVRVYDYGLSEVGPYYTMELLEGDDLLQLAPLPWREACSLLRDIASSLAIVHSRRLLHRDVSPRNVRRDQDGRAKLIDFGAMASMGSVGELIGTPPCMPPETVNAQPLDARADLFALGAVAYWMLTGTQAYSSRSVRGLRDAWRSRPRAPSSCLQGIPRDLDRLVLSLLSLDALARPGSAAEVIEHLTVIAGLDATEHVAVARAYLSAPTLLARDDELLRFRKQLLRCGRGRGSVAIIEGAAGMGRSRLISAVELEGKLAGASVLRARGEPEHTFGVLRALSRELLANLPEPALAAARPLAPRLAHVVPELREQLAGIELVAAKSKQELEAQIESAACEWLVAISQYQSLLITVDDVHCADAASLSLLALLAQYAAEQRLTLVLSCLEDASAVAPLALSTLRRKASLVRLAPLDEAQTAQLARSLFGEVANVSQVAVYLYRLARGNPRTSMELAAHLVERGIARYERGAWSLPGTLPEQALPTSLENTLDQRLNALSAAALELACGLALSDVTLDLTEYPQLLGEGEAASQRMFEALDELVAASVLVTRDDAYAFRHAGFIAAALRVARLELRHELCKRLAKIFDSRGDLARAAGYLIEGGEELAALETLAQHHRDTGGYLSPEPPESKRSTRIDRSWQVENTRAAVETSKRLLDAAERHHWPARERLMIRNGLLLLANQYDASLMRGYVEPQLQELRRYTGALYWDQFAGSSSDHERALHCFAYAQALHDAAAVSERVMSPREAIGALAFTIGIAQSLGRQGQELPLLEHCLALAHFVVCVSPNLRWFHTTVVHALELVRGRVDVAASIRRSMLDYYDALQKSDKLKTPVERLGFTIAIQLEGFEHARAARADALACADWLEGPLVPDFVTAGIGTHLWVRRAWEIRRVFHLYRGHVGEARNCQEQLDRLSTRHAYSPYGGGGSFFEAQAFGMSADMMGLKQSIGTIGAIVEQTHPNWAPFLHVATGDYHRLRNEPERALQAYDRALAICRAGTHSAWGPAASARVEALLALDRVQLAQESARVALADCRRVELGALCEIESTRVLALAEARSGDTETARAHLERAFTLAAQHDVHGIRLGVLHEARARVALAAHDDAEFTAAAMRTAEIYRAGGNPALVAKYERLMDAARALAPLSQELMNAADISSALGLPNTSQNFHSVLDAASDATTRKAQGLRLLLKHSGANSGFLYSANARGEVSLEAAVGEAEPPLDLAGALSAYLRAELDDTSDVTVTCFDDAGHTSKFDPLSEFQPVLIWHTARGARAIAGIAALRCTRERFITPSFELLEAVSSVFVEPQPTTEVRSFVGSLPRSP